jgi:hypothetical protein
MPKHQESGATYLLFPMPMRFYIYFLSAIVIYGQIVAWLSGL